MIQEIKLKDNHILRIIQSECPESPNSWEDTELFLVYGHRQFDIRRKGFDVKDVFNYLNYPDKPTKKDTETEEDFNNKLEEWENNKDFCDYSDYYIFSVDAYIHSGVSLSLSGTKTKDRFDTSTCGFILVKNTIKENLTENEAENYAEGLIDVWNNYLSGNIYDFNLIKRLNIKDIITNNLSLSFSKKGYNIPVEVIKNSLNENLIKELEGFSEEIVESCGGFYNDDIYTNGIFEYVPEELLTDEIKEKLNNK